MELLTHWDEFGDGEEALSSPGDILPALKPRLPAIISNGLFPYFHCIS